MLLICLYSHRNVPPKFPKLLSHPSHYLNLRDQEPSYSMIIYYSFLVVQRQLYKNGQQSLPQWNLLQPDSLWIETCRQAQTARDKLLFQTTVSRDRCLTTAWIHSSVAPSSWLLVSRTYPGVRTINRLAVLPLLWLLKLLRVNHFSCFTGKVDEYSKVKWYRGHQDAVQYCWPVKE